MENIAISGKGASGARNGNAFSVTVQGNGRGISGNGVVDDDAQKNDNMNNYSSLGNHAAADAIQYL